MVGNSIELLVLLLLFVGFSSLPLIPGLRTARRSTTLFSDLVDERSDDNTKYETFMTIQHISK